MFPNKERDSARKDRRGQGIEILGSLLSRLRGLLFREPDEVTRLLVPCNDVHTFGMKYDIDIAFISKDGVVLETFMDVGPKRRLRHRQAAMVAERFSQRGGWIRPGDRLEL